MTHIETLQLVSEAIGSMVAHKLAGIDTPDECAECGGDHANEPPCAIEHATTEEYDACELWHHAFVPTR